MLPAVIDHLIVGPGGVGGFLAAHLARSGRDVAVVARREHGAAIAARGLRLVDPDLPEGGLVARLAVAPTLDDAPPARVVVLAVKHPDLAALLDPLARYLLRCPLETVVVALQNGVAHLEGPLLEATGGRLLGGAVYIFSAVSAPGEVSVVGGPRLYRIGPVGSDPVLGRRAADIVAAWRAAGVRAGVAPDGRQVAWEKLVLLAPLSGMTALTGRTVAELRSTPGVVDVFRRVAEEVAAIATAEGFPVASDVVEVAVTRLRTTDGEGRSSLWLDLTRGRPSEIDVLLGDPLRRARRHGVAAPALEVVEALTRARYGLAADAGEASVVSHAGERDARPGSSDVGPAGRATGER